MAHIEKRGENSWRLTVYVGTDAKGKRIPERKRIKVTDPALLRAPKRLQDYLNHELAKFKIEVESGHYISPDKMAFSSFVEEWKEKFVSGLEYKTRLNYHFHADKRIVPHFGHMRMDQITTMHIVQYLTSLSKPGARADGKPGGLGSASIVYNYRVLRSIFSSAADWKVIAENPMVGVKKPKEEETEMDFYTPEEIQQLYEAIESELPHVRMFVLLAFTTGMRRGEILGLKWERIDLENGVLEVIDTIPAFANGQPIIKRPKNKKTRKVALSSSIVAELKEYRDFQRNIKRQIEKIVNLKDGPDVKYVFQNIETGLPYHPETLKKAWRIIFDRNPKLRYISFHALRHTAATIMISKGVHAKVIANRLGHKNIKTTMNVYGHVFESADQAAADVFDDLIPQKKHKL